jgi:hypothetical protein
MFLVIHSKGIESVAVYSAALKTAQRIADETREKARVYRAPSLVEFVACPSKQVIDEPPLEPPKKARKKKS